MLYIGFARQLPRAVQTDHTEGFERMTYLDVVFNFGHCRAKTNCAPSTACARCMGFGASASTRKDRTVMVQFDASRLKQDAVAKLLRQAGIDVQEPVALAQG